MSSIRGTAHELSGQPNQDALFIEPASSVQPQAIPFTVAIADGHGGWPHFRSEQGSRFAVKVACRVLTEYLKATPAPGSEKETEHHLKRLILGDWLKEVSAHVSANPFSTSETDIVLARSSPEFAARIKDHPEIAYGSTLLALAISPHAVVIIQLGDGDVLTSFSDGAIIRPFPETSHSENDSWVETDSLSNPEAWKDLRISVTKGNDSDLSFFLLSTDGLRKAYASEAAFQQVVPDIVAAFRTEGFMELDRSLPRLLRTSSQDGGGDDVTAVFGFRATSISSEWMPNIVAERVLLTRDGSADKELLKPDTL